MFTGGFLGESATAVTEGSETDTGAGAGAPPYTEQTEPIYLMTES